MIDKLIERIEELQNPTLVGLDPRLNLIPSFIKDNCYKNYGANPRAVGEAILEFNRRIIDAVYDLVPAVKPQIAMYEQYGPEGIRAYSETINYAKQRGLLVIGDIKRGDVASTAQAYADGHIGRILIKDKEFEIYKSDAITLNPYLGFDAIEPYIGHCKNYGKGLFILVKTSNPNSGEIQDLDVGGKKLYEKIGDKVKEWGKDLIGERGYSSIGAVVGATHPQQARRLRQIMPYSYFLVPGYGAQGARAEDLKGFFNKDGLGAIINSSRGIIAAYRNAAYKDKFKEEEFDLAARAATIDMKKDLRGIF